MNRRYFFHTALAGAAIPLTTITVPAIGRKDGIPTPFNRLNELMGGFKNGETYSIRGLPGSGRISLAIKLADYAGSLGYTVWFMDSDIYPAALLKRFKSNNVYVVHGHALSYLKSWKPAFTAFPRAEIVFASSFGIDYYNLYGYYRAAEIGIPVVVSRQYAKNAGKFDDLYMDSSAVIEAGREIRLLKNRYGRTGVIGSLND